METNEIIGPRLHLNSYNRITRKFWKQTPHCSCYALYNTDTACTHRQNITTTTRTTKFQLLPNETVVVGLSSERPCLSLTGSYLECSYLNSGTPDVRLVRCPFVFCSAPRVTSPSLPSPAPPQPPLGVGAGMQLPHE